MPVSIENYLHTLNYPNALGALKETLDKLQPTITFWGERIVEPIGQDSFEGSFDLEELAHKIVAAANLRSDRDDLTLQERIIGIEITKKLCFFYKETDTQINNSNILTRLFNYIREFTLWPYTTRFYLEDGTLQKFQNFSDERYFQTFGTRDIEDSRFAGGWSGPPPRVCVRESAIRARLGLAPL